MSEKPVLAVLLLSSLVLVPAFALQAAEPLGSSEQFKIDQVHRSLDNVDKDLERIATAGREGTAGMALKGARRNLGQARDRLEQFLSRNRSLISHPDVEAVSSRLDQLAAAVEQSLNQPVNQPVNQPDAAGSTPAASTASSESKSPAAAPANQAAASPVRGSSSGSSSASSNNNASLSRKQQFELQQIGTAIGNAEKSLEAFREADREDMAALALKGAKRGHAESAERLTAFVEANIGAAGSPEVADLKTRISSLAGAIESAETGARAAQAAAAATGASASEDAQRILDLQAEHVGILGSIHGRSVVYSDDAEAVEKALATIEAAEAAAETMRPFLLEFRDRYGSESAAIEAALDTAGADADSSNSRVAYNAVALFEFLDKLQRTRAVSAETVADHIAARMADIDDYSAKVQQQRLDEAAEMIRTGQKIDPNNPELNRLRGEVAQLAAARQEAQKARIASATWPDHAASFSGPGGVDDLSRSVQQYLADDRDWGQSEQRPQEVLAVSVTGPWQVAAKDMFGQPIQWRLPVMVAITDDELRPDGVAQAFEVSMVAKEGAPNQAPKSPPWDGFWVGDNYYLELGELR